MKGSQEGKQMTLAEKLSQTNDVADMANAICECFDWCLECPFHDSKRNNRNKCSVIDFLRTEVDDEGKATS